MDQTALFIKRDPIAEDRVIVLLKFFGILPVFDLLQSLCTALLQTTKRFGILGLEENDLRSVWMINDDVAAPFAVFPVGLYRAARAGQDENAMGDAGIQKLWVSEDGSKVYFQSTLENDVYPYNPDGTYGKLLFAKRASTP